jgi:ATP-dependent RNA helicase DeaD
VVIATLAERRKAERLLAMAQVRVPWTTPPSAKQIAAAARTQLIDGLLAEATLDGAAASGVQADAGAETETGEDDLLAPFRGKLSAEDLARRLLARELERLPAGEKLAPVPLPSAGGERGFGRGAPERPSRNRTPGDFAREGVRFRVNLGGKDQADPRWLLPLICRRGGVTRREVGAIRIGPQETVFEIAGDAAGDFALAAAETDPRAPHVRVERIDSGAGATTFDARPPHAAMPFATKPQSPKPHAAKPYTAKPDGAKPYAAKPYTAKGFATIADSAKPHAAKPHSPKPHSPKPHAGKPHAGKPHAGKPHPTSSHAGPSSGGDRPYKRPHAARPDRFQAKPGNSHPHPAGKRRA